MPKGSYESEQPPSVEALPASAARSYSDSMQDARKARKAKVREERESKASKAKRAASATGSQDQKLGEEVGPEKPLRLEDTGLPTLRVAVVGCGWFARRMHLPVLQKLQRTRGNLRGFHLRLVALCSLSEESLKAALHVLGPEAEQVRCHTSLDKVLADTEVDVVDLVLPIPEMPAAIEAVLEAGKHVISEKPAAPSAAASCRLWQAYQRLGGAGQLDQGDAPLPVSERRRAGLAWCVQENWSHKPGVARVAALIQEGAVGNPTSYSLVVRRGLPSAQSTWRDQQQDDPHAAWAVDIGVHAVRAVRMWFGEVRSAGASTPDDQTLPGGKWEAAGKLEHITGVVGTMELGLFVQGTKDAAEVSHVEIRGDRGDILLWDMLNQRITVKPAQSPPGLAATTASEPSVDFTVHGDGWVGGGVRDSIEDALRQCAVVQGLVRAPAAGGAPHRTSAEDALRDSAVMRAFLRPDPAPPRPGADSGVRASEEPTSQGACKAPPLHHPGREWPLLAPGGYHLPTAGGVAGGQTGDPPLAVARCRTVGEVAAAMRTAAGAGVEARASGAGNSWSGCSEAAGGVRIDTSLMDLVLWAEDDLVCVQAGVLLRDLVKALQGRGKMLRSLPVLLDQTIAGAAATGSHGSSLHTGTVADAVEGAVVVLPGGVVRRLGRLDRHPVGEAQSSGGVALGGEGRQKQLDEEEEELLRAVRCGCGAAGVIVELVLQVESSYLVRKHEVAVPRSWLQDLALVDMRALLQRYEHVWVHWRLPLMGAVPSE
ncbi:hypothetical protein CYMTET_35832, partial [Cymbomonas tetramitiformis]